LKETFTVQLKLKFKLLNCVRAFFWICLYSSKKHLHIQNSDFIEVMDKATSLMRNESGRIGNLTVTNSLVKIEPLGEALVIGDLHGDLASLIIILQKSRFIEKMEKSKETALIFLGDYGDRGDRSAEIYYTVLQLKLAFPGQVVLLRGNHEAPNDLLGYPHDLPDQFQNKFGGGWKLAYEKTRALSAYLFNAVYVEERYLMVHGGVSPEIITLQDISQAQEDYNETLLEDLLWNDPDEDVQGVSFSPRGAGKLFGKKVTEEVLGKLRAKILIRGHESSHVGFKINHGGKVLTLFSRKGSPYFNKYGAYLQLTLSEKVENVQQLAPCIHKF
jgi:diadenosine tetraphosphatase ApaH/serine/threonine PP2A family protein phosphatase